MAKRYPNFNSIISPDIKICETSADRPCESVRFSFDLREQARKRHWNLYNFVVIIFLGFCDAAVAAEDILGLRIGISPKEARQSLLQINANFHITEQPDASRNALLMQAFGSDELIVLEFTETQPRAFFIGRSVAFAPGQRPTKEALKNDLIAKYKKPASMEVGRPWGDFYSWPKSTPKSSYTPKQYDFRGCGRFPTGQSKWSALPGTSSVFLYITSVECDRLIEASVGSALNENPDIAGSLGVSITDYAMARSDPRNPHNLNAEAEKKQLENARKNKPKL